MQQATQSEGVRKLCRHRQEDRTFLRIYCHQKQCLTLFPPSLALATKEVQLGEVQSKLVILYLLVSLSMGGHQWQSKGKGCKTWLRRVINFDTPWLCFGHCSAMPSHICPRSKQTKCSEANKVTSEDRTRRFSKAATLSSPQGYWFSHLHSLLCASYLLMTPCPFSVVYICVCCAALRGTSISDESQGEDMVALLTGYSRPSHCSFMFEPWYGELWEGLLAGKVQMEPTMLKTFWWYANPVQCNATFAFDCSQLKLLVVIARCPLAIWTEGNYNIDE